MEEIDILNFINQQLDYLNGTDSSVGLIENQENQITVFLNGRDEQDLSKEERHALRIIRNELVRRTQRRDELEMLRNRFDELSGSSSLGQTFAKIDTINKVFAERKKRRLGKNVIVSTAEPNVHYVETGEASVTLSTSIGEDIKRAKSNEANVVIGANNPVGRVKGDGLEIMKNIISLQALIEMASTTYGEDVATPEQISTAKILLKKMMKIAKKEYDYSEKHEELVLNSSKAENKKANEPEIIQRSIPEELVKGKEDDNEEPDDSIVVPKMTEKEPNVEPQVEDDRLEIERQKGKTTTEDIEIETDDEEPTTEETSTQEESDKKKDSQKEPKVNQNKDTTEGVRIGLIGSILAAIFKFLKFITQKIGPLNSFISGIEDSFYATATPKFLNSGDLKDKKKGVFSNIKDIDQLSENIKYVFENRKSEIFKEIYAKEGAKLRNEFKGLNSRRGQQKLTKLMIKENIPETLNDKADTVISYKTLIAFVDKAKEDGIIPKDADFRDIDIKEICEVIKQQNLAEEVKNNKDQMRKIKDIVLDKSEFNPIRDIFMEELEKISNELDALSPSERMKRISELMKDEKVAVLIGGKNYTNIALLRTLNRVNQEIIGTFNGIRPDNLNEDLICARAIQANIKVIDDDDKMVDLDIIKEELKEYQENIRKSDEAAKGFKHSEAEKKSDEKESKEDSKSII